MNTFMVIIMPIMLSLFTFICFYTGKKLLMSKRIITFILTTLFNSFIIMISIPTILHYYHVDINYSLRISIAIYTILFLTTFVIWFIKVPLKRSKNIPKDLFYITIIFLTSSTLSVIFGIYRIINDVLNLG